jgi:hypothetical protein
MLKDGLWAMGFFWAGQALGESPDKPRPVHHWVSISRLAAARLNET